MLNLNKQFFCVSLLLLGALPFLLASTGDRSPVYQNCVKKCLNFNCTDDQIDFKNTATAQQDVWDTMLFWNCKDECRYHCMWKTVDKFWERGFRTPKFHGKWPFHRYFGIQEPAAVLASILNMASNYYMFKQLKQHWYRKDVPMVTLWVGFSVLCMNTWWWSVVFHTRDAFLTEFMDYSGAFLMVLAFFVAALNRILLKWHATTRALSALLFVFYLQHCRYLLSGKVDYEYNMTVNVLFGIVGTSMWAVWALCHFLSGQRYAARMVAFTALSGLTLGLELFDFEPLLGGWDAHALWHLSTAPMPFILCQFVQADLAYLEQQQLAGVKLA